jgi:hypothetical protein
MASKASMASMASVALLAAGCAGVPLSGNPSAVNGSGIVETEERSVEGFSEIEITTTGDVFITQGDSESLTIEAEDNVLPILTSQVIGDRLVLSTRPNVIINLTEPIVYRITVIDLQAVEVFGVSTVEALDLDLDRLDVTISGNGTFNLSGTVDEQTLEISGTGTYNAGELASRTMAITINGSGNATVNVSDQLDVTINGSGNVSYFGSPNVDTDITGSGDVVPVLE